LAVEFPCLHASGNGRPHQMNRQDAKDAKEIENLDMFVIGASVG
jgi:hypothetical protein